METLRLTRDVTSLPENFWSQLDPPALAFATSGSTDEPRWIRHSREALLLSAAAVNRCFAVTPQDVWLRALPLFHVAGVGVEARANAAGCRLVILQGGWDVVEFIKLVNHEKVTLTSLVPTQVFDLVQTGQAAPSSLRAVLVGGGRLEPDLALRAKHLGWPLRSSYGLTEAASTVAVEDAAGRLQLLDVWEARVNADGLLELRSAVLPSPEWLVTGDRGEVTDREIRWLGRSDLLVKICGELVDISRIEASLSRLAGREITVLALPDARAGNRLMASQIEGEILTRYHAGCPPLDRISGLFSDTYLQRSALGKIRRAATAAAIPAGGITGV